MRFWVRASGRLELEIIDDHNGVKIPARENSGFTNQTVTYTYDSWGNLTEKNVYAYTTATDPGTPTDTKSYTYSTGDWKDQLASYGNQTIVYDAMGNPTTYRGKAMTWRGKQLTGIAVGTDAVAYSYDENGLRLQKTVNNVASESIFAIKLSMRKLLRLYCTHLSLRCCLYLASLLSLYHQKGTMSVESLSGRILFI